VPGEMKPVVRDDDDDDDDENNNNNNNNDNIVLGNEYSERTLWERRNEYWYNIYILISQTHPNKKYERIICLRIFCSILQSAIKVAGSRDT